MHARVGGNILVEVSFEVSTYPFGICITFQSRAATVSRGKNDFSFHYGRISRKETVTASRVGFSNADTPCAFLMLPGKKTWVESEHSRNHWLRF